MNRGEAEAGSQELEVAGQKQLETDLNAVKVPTEERQDILSKQMTNNRTPSMIVLKQIRVLMAN